MTLLGVVGVAGGDDGGWGGPWFWLVVAGCQDRDVLG